MRHFFYFTLIGLFAFVAPSYADDPAPTKLGEIVPDFHLVDVTGRKISLRDYKDQKAIVVLFIGTECPINNLYMSVVRDLHKEFATKSVQFLALNANCQDTAEEIAAHAKKHELPFPVMRDPKNVVADRFGVRRTPEAFVLDSFFRIRYQGRIDDRFGIEIQRPAPKRRDLAEAIQEVLDGEKVSVPTTEVAGCILSRYVYAPAKGPVTYTKHIARIVQNNCQECHRPGQIGPMALTNYDDVKAWGEMIAEVVSQERMPPWYADPQHGKFANDRRLPAADKKLLLTWINNGMPQGDAKDLPPPKSFPKGWRIGNPDVVIKMPRPYQVPAEMPRRGVPYQYLTVQTKFDKDMWVERAEARPGTPSVVHHMIVFIVPPGERFFPGNPRTPLICGTAPGDMPTILKPGYAKHVPKGASLVFQMHYTPIGKAVEDRSSIGLIFAKKAPKKAVITKPVLTSFFRIPPNDANYEVQSRLKLKRDVDVISFMPHMHLRGKDFLYRVAYPDGKSKVLLSVPRFNFNWQSVYRLEKPLRLPKGAYIQCVAHYDNSANNPNNPDPNQVVYWGDQTWEEMMIGWVDLAYDREE